jgi:hypothetical protein
MSYHQRISGMRMKRIRKIVIIVFILLIKPKFSKNKSVKWMLLGVKMKIAIDMDNTLIDEFGSTIRPGIVDFLEKLSQRHSLVLWTNSTKARAIDMLYRFNLRNFFEKIIAREDYYDGDAFMPKDLRRFCLDIIIDDDPEEIDFNASHNKTAILVESYRKGKTVNHDELNNIMKKYKLV